MLNKIKEFNELYNLRSETYSPGSALSEMLYGLIDEEVAELREALDKGDVHEVYDAIGDTLYVVLGFCVRLNIPIEEVFNEVHRSNLSKLGEDGKPIYREDGKLLKGENFTPPDFTDMIR